MYLYNSATHKKEELKTHTPNHVEMYTCGPTVYHFAHIGNLRSYIMEDVLEKYLRFAGYSVNRVMNITDVGHLTSDADEGEDKMLKGAKREHKSVMEIAQFYTDAFFADCQKLHIKRPDVVQPATGLIDDYIKIITRLLDTGYAYLAGGNVYFDTSKLDRYYIFNDHNEEDLAVGVREGVEEDTNKKNKNDFVLWFTKSKFEDQALKWDSPWGVGYPGWHIECSGISMKYNGEYLDLHCGGVDNAFPHHTNEIAQSESYLGHPWCPHWCHVAHLNTTDGKMSKSKGEFLTVSLLEQKGYDPLAYRFFCLQHIPLLLGQAIQQVFYCKTQRRLFFIIAKPSVYQSIQLLLGLRNTAVSLSVVRQLFIIMFLYPPDLTPYCCPQAIFDMIAECSRSLWLPHCHPLQHHLAQILQNITGAKLQIITVIDQSLINQPLKIKQDLQFSLLVPLLRQYQQPFSRIKTITVLTVSKKCFQITLQFLYLQIYTPQSLLAIFSRSQHTSVKNAAAVIFSIHSQQISPPAVSQ